MEIGKKGLAAPSWVVAAISCSISAQILTLMYPSAAAQRRHKATQADKQEILLGMGIQALQVRNTNSILFSLPVEVM